MPNKKQTKKSMPKTYHGEPTKLGGGGRFEMLQDKIQASGKSSEAAAAIAASIGRKKIGAKKFNQVAAKGRKGK